MSNEVNGRMFRALLVDQASSQRNRLVEVLAGEGDIVVVGEASTAADAIAKVVQLGPDVVILDLHLPGGQSLHTIEQVMARNPTPILILSARIDDRQSTSAVQALVAGALEVLPRPAEWTAELGAELRQTVRLFSTVHVIRHPRGGLPVDLPRNARPRSGCQPVVAIAASTGGPSALATIFSGLAGLVIPVLRRPELIRWPGLGGSTLPRAGLISG
jgi:two-component system chemotaxis response regulator CheB